MDAFLVEFKTVVFADNQTEAMARVKVWRSLAAAAGYEPGSGVVKALTEGELGPDLQRALEKARSKVNVFASTHAAEQAIQDLSSHLDGDLETATRIVRSMTDETGRLPAIVPQALATARRAGEQEQAAA